MRPKSRQIALLDQKFKSVSCAQECAMPVEGWLRATRKALGITLEQVGSKLGLTKQGMSRLEKREKEGSITLANLRKSAEALDLELVYVLMPKDGTLRALIERKAHEMAVEIVQRASTHMELEAQQNSPARVEEAIAEHTDYLIREMPSWLWD